MTKEDTIRRFKDACDNPENNADRIVAVNSQSQRNVWELPDEDGLIRIENFDSSPKITVFHAIEYAKENNYGYTFEGELTSEEYNQLVILFFGEYADGGKHFKKLVKDRIRKIKS